MAGNLYGTAEGGGTNQSGVIFKLDPAGNYTVLHAFTGPDGASPAADLTLDSAGNLYGTAFGGGQGICAFGGGCGVVFKLDPTGNYSVLYSFTGGADGGSPQCKLLLDASNGYLYGTTVMGGNDGCLMGNHYHGCGVVFRLKL